MSSFTLQLIYDQQYHLLKLTLYDIVNFEQVKTPFKFSQKNFNEKNQYLILFILVQLLQVHYYFFIIPDIQKFKHNNIFF